MSKVLVDREVLELVLNSLCAAVEFSNVGNEDSPTFVAVCALRAALEHPGVEPHQVRWCDGCTPENCAGCVRV